MCVTHDRLVSHTTNYQVQLRLFDNDGEFEWFDSGVPLDNYGDTLDRLSTFPEKYMDNFRIVMVTTVREIVG